MTKYHAKFPNFMQNLETRETVNSTKHRIAIPNKTVTGHYGSSTVFMQVNDQSGQQWKFLGVHTALCGVVEHRQFGVWSQNWGVLGGVRGVKYHCLQCKRQFARSGQIWEFHIFAPATAAPCTVPPGRMPHSLRPSFPPPQMCSIQVLWF